MNLNRELDLFLNRQSDFSICFMMMSIKKNIPQIYAYCKRTKTPLWLFKYHYETVSWNYKPEWHGRQINAFIRVKNYFKRKHNHKIGISEIKEYLQESYIPRFYKLLDMSLRELNNL